MRGSGWRWGAVVLAAWLVGCGGEEPGDGGLPQVPDAPQAPTVPPVDTPPTDAPVGRGSLGFVRQYDQAGRERPGPAAAGPDGGFVVLGSTVRETPTQQPDVVIARHVSFIDRFDREGNLLGTVELPPGVWAYTVAVTQERILVAGVYEHAPTLAGKTLPRVLSGRGMYLLTLTRTGEPVSVQSWVVRVGRAPPHRTDVDTTHLRADASGGAVLVGRYRGELDLGAGALPQEDPRVRKDSTFVARFTPQGQLLWARSLRTSVAVRAVAVGPAGDVAIGGMATDADADLGEGPWRNAARTPFVAGLDAATGRVRWHHVLAGAEGTVMGAATTPAGFTFAGTWRGGGFSFAGTQLTPPTGEGTDLMLLRVDPQGQPVWARQYGGGLGEHMLQLVADPEGRLTLSMSARGAVHLGGETLTAPGDRGERAQMFVAAYDDTGAHAWSRMVPNLGGTDIAGHALLAQPGGDVVLATSLAEPGQLEGRALTPIAEEDQLLLQLRR